MLKVNFGQQVDSTFNVLCLGAHCDDIEIGCGGTILKLIEQYRNTAFYWVVFSSDQEREIEAQKSANIFLNPIQEKHILIKNYRDGFLPYSGREIKEDFECLKHEFSPDLILTHYRKDLHQDHRLISDLTWNTFRNHLILEYEIPKYDGDFGSPSVFVHLSDVTCHKKIQHILDSYESQRHKPWFGEETFRSILRLRGMESNAPSKYAEAFYCRKIVLGLRNQAVPDSDGLGR